MTAFPVTAAPDSDQNENIDPHVVQDIPAVKVNHEQIARHSPSWMPGLIATQIEGVLLVHYTALYLHFLSTTPLCWIAPLGSHQESPCIYGDCV